MMKSPTASAPMVTGPRMRSSMTMSPRGHREAQRRRLARPRAAAAPRPAPARGSGGRSAACALRPAPRAQLLEALLRAEAAVGAPGREQLVGGGPVAAPAARSAGTGRHGPPTSGPSSQSSPSQRRSARMRVLERCVRARGVGVVDAQHEAAAGVPREQEVEERRARRADVQRARRARREADSHCRVEGYGCSSNVVDSPAKQVSLSSRDPATCRERLLAGRQSPVASRQARPARATRRRACRTTSARPRTSTPCCATARPATRRSTRRATSSARAPRPAARASRRRRALPSTSPWPAASRTRASPRT